MTREGYVAVTGGRKNGERKTEMGVKSSNKLFSRRQCTTSHVNVGIAQTVEQINIIYVWTSLK
jgi:hypothetical protein